MKDVQNQFGTTLHDMRIEQTHSLKEYILQLVQIRQVPSSPGHHNKV
jgi:hypothetical protein